MLLVTASWGSWESKGTRQEMTSQGQQPEQTGCSAARPCRPGAGRPAASQPPAPQSPRPSPDLMRSSPALPSLSLPTCGSLPPFYLLTAALTCGTPVLTVICLLCSPINLPLSGDGGHLSPTCGQGLQPSPRHWSCLRPNLDLGPSGACR